MEKWERPAEQPPELKARRGRLTLKFIQAKRETKRTPTCEWPAVTENGVTLTFPRWMASKAGGHCNYCDGLLSYQAEPTIDHFMPKESFACSAYLWRNLYVACRGCQRKGTRFDKLVLRPDEQGYHFTRYFRYRRNGEIVATSDEADRARAEKTIEVLKLDHPDLTKDRRRAFNQGALQRQRPLPAGLAGHGAKALVERRAEAFGDRPYRAFWYQGSTD